jgi:glutamyl-tRNA synthetase
VSATGLAESAVGRLAPSPTGYLHLGHARSFLLAWWSARSRGGRVALRVEDLDRERCKPGLAAVALRDLEWLGLDWDGEPLVQSRDLAPYERACAALFERGLAYPCTCTRAEIAALSAPHAGDGEARYPGTCRGRWSSLEEARAATGRDPGLRFAVPEGEIEVEDALAGRARFDVAREVGDFLLRRRDGAYAYQLSVVVDDARQGVSEVVRGADLLPSAARQTHLQRALGLPHPRWCHVPLVVDAQGERLAKRRGDLALASLRGRGVDPRAVVAWVASSCGLGGVERATAAEFVSRFDLARVPRNPVVLDAATIDALMRARLAGR